MNTVEKIQVIKDLASRKITVTRYFDASPDLVWRAWTEAELLDQWWAPKPYRAETKEMHFRNAGYWLYSMVGPEADRHWCKVDFSNIDEEKSFDGATYFCDENGNRNNDMPGMNWHNKFYADGNISKLVVEISFDSEADLERIIELGFEQGFTSALGNLEEYLAPGK